MRKFLPFLIIPLLVLVAGCMDIPNNLVMPQWDVNLNVPIVNRSYALNDIIKTQNYISVQNPNTPNNIYLIQSDNYSQTVGVSQFVQAAGTEATHANVPTNLGTQTLSVPFPGGVTISSAVFTSGFLSYSFTNPSQQNVTINLSIPGVMKTDGTVFSQTIQLSPLATDSAQFNFSNYTYASSTPSNGMQIMINATSNLPTLIGVSLYTKDFFFSSATGYIPTKSLGIKTQSFGLNINKAKDYRNKITLGNADLSLDASYLSSSSNPFGIQVKNLSIIGKRNDGSQISLTIPDSAKTFTFTNRSKHFDFDQTNSSITSFIAFLPDSVIVSAEYIMNPNNTNGTVTSKDSVSFTANFSTTSFLAISYASVKDTSSFGSISNNDRTKIRAAQSAYITVNVQNGIPLNSSITVIIADSNYNPLFTLVNNTAGADSFSIAPASVGQNGEVSGSTPTSFTIQLDSLQTGKFSHAQYAIYTVGVQTANNPTPVYIRPNDQIQIQVYGGVKFRVNQDNLK
ncbi:MAG: hypothetical protein ACYDA4_10155 [Ignavibacteriaceae bacterium]